MDRGPCLIESQDDVAVAPGANPPPVVALVLVVTAVVNVAGGRDHLARGRDGA